MSAILDLERILVAIILSVTRLAAVMAIVPFLSEALISRALRSLFAVSLAVIVVPLVYMQLPPDGVGPTDAFILIPKEILLGLFFGFLAGIPFWVAASVGRMMDIQRGAFTASMYTPVYRDQASIMGSLFAQAATVLLFTTGGFLLLIDAIYASYSIWPVLSWVPNLDPDGLQQALEYFQNIMLWTFILASPCIIVVFLIDLVMGLLNRFVPEINVFFLALPFKGLGVFFIMAVYMTTVVDYITTQFVTGEEWIERLRGFLG